MSAFLRRLYVSLEDRVSECPLIALFSTDTLEFLESENLVPQSPRSVSVADLRARGQIAA